MTTDTILAGLRAIYYVLAILVAVLIVFQFAVV